MIWENNDCFEYLINLPPVSYVNSNFLDWLKIYLQNLINNISNNLSFSYQNSEKTLELKLKDVEKLEQKIKHYLINQKGYSVDEAKDFKYFANKDLPETDSIVTNYMIGKTI